MSPEVRIFFIFLITMYFPFSCIFVFCKIKIVPEILSRDSSSASCKNNSYVSPVYISCMKSSDQTNHAVISMSVFFLQSFLQTYCSGRAEKNLFKLFKGTDICSTKSNTDRIIHRISLLIQDIYCIHNL